MSYYGITRVHWNKANTCVDKVFLQKIVKSALDSPEIGLADGEPKSYYDVASLLAAGHTILVMLPDAMGSYQTGDKVRVKSGQHGCLESFSEDGRSTNSLYELPTWPEG